MKFTGLFSLVIAFGFISCFPKDMKEKMGEAIKKSNVMVNDMQFRSALNNIELYKLRTGQYPETLNDLTYVSVMDSSYMLATEYKRLAVGYELNLKVVNQTPEPYPDDFWKGLGCVKSNMMREGFVYELQQADTLNIDSAIVQ